MPNENEPFLLDMRQPWEDEWQGMPQFSLEDLTPYKTMYVHFSSPGDIQAFSDLIGQTVTERTRSVWVPEAEIGRYANKRYVREE